jgi:nucleoside 2-deoxyribosyltransferase
MKIFLSGGTHGGWQDLVKSRFPMTFFFDPRQAGKQKTMKEIAELERLWLDQSDILFFYFENSNPSGIGSAFEVGYCIGRNIPVIMVDEQQTRYTEWLGIHCTKVYQTLDQGLAELEKWILNV